MGKIYDIIIIGNGPAGLTAAIYAARAGYQALVVSDNPSGGGQIATTYEVANYPGLNGISGMELGEKFREHAKTLGAEELLDRVSAIEEVKGAESNEAGFPLLAVITAKERLLTKSVIIATGADHRKLKVPGEDRFSGAGVSYCATCDGGFFRKKTVAVVGGGDVALEDAIYLSRFAEKVYIIHRRDEFRGVKALQEELLSNEKIEPIYDTVVTEIVGETSVKSLKLKNVKTEEERELPVNGVFMAVGIKPNLEGIGGLPELDEAGYIKADESCVTSIPGIFAAGDVRTKALRQVITAAADGANAVTSIGRYFTEGKR